MTSERQKQGIDGEAPSARDLKKAGEYQKVNLDAHAGEPKEEEESS